MQDFHAHLLEARCRGAPQEIEITRHLWEMVLPSSSTSRTAPALKSSVKLRRGRFCLFPSSMSYSQSRPMRYAGSSKSMRAHLAAMG